MAIDFNQTQFATGALGNMPMAGANEQIAPTLIALPLSLLGINANISSQQSALDRILPSSQGLLDPNKKFLSLASQRRGNGLSSFYQNGLQALTDASANFKPSLGVTIEAPAIGVNHGDHHGDIAAIAHSNFDGIGDKHHDITPLPTPFVRGSSAGGGTLDI